MREGLVAGWPLRTLVRAIVLGALFVVVQAAPSEAAAQDTYPVYRMESEYQRLDERYTLRMRAFGMCALVLEVAGLIGFAAGDPPHGRGGAVLGLFSAGAVVFAAALGVVARRRGLLRYEGYMPDMGTVLLRF